MLDIHAMIRNSPEARRPNPFLSEAVAESYRMICEDFRFKYWLQDQGIITREVTPDTMRLEFGIRDMKAYFNDVRHFCRRNRVRWGWTADHINWNDTGVVITFRINVR